MSVFSLARSANVAPATGATTINADPTTVPIVAFTGSPVSGDVPLLVAFTNTSSNATNYLWDFGDGSTSTEVNPSHTFAVAGSYNITLTATGSGGSASLIKVAYIAAGVPTVLTATITGPSAVELYKPYTYLIELNQAAPGSYDVDVMQGGVKQYELTMKGGVFARSYKAVVFTSASSEVVDFVIRRSSTTATHPLPVKVGAPITVTKLAATRLDLLGPKGGPPDTWVRFAVQPNGPIASAVSAVLYATDGEDQTSIYPATVRWSAGEVGRKEFWVYRHTAGSSQLRLVSSAGYPVVDSDTLIFGDGSWADRAFRNHVLFHHSHARTGERSRDDGVSRRHQHPRQSRRRPPAP